MTKKTFFPFLLVSLLFLLIFSSCGREDYRRLKREDLFTLSLGVMADELDYVYRERILLPGTSQIFMKEGIFYISSQNMSKVMTFNSFGDLMTLIFNQEINPIPRELVISQGIDQANKRFVPWSFNSPGILGLSGENLLVEDRISSDLAYFDEELMASCDRILLRFDENGEYLDFIGREGIGGQPFPHIQDLSFRNNGEFVVTCRIFQGWVVYWYSPSGELLYRVRFNDDQLPFYKEGYQSIVNRLMADPQYYQLYLMTSLYSQTDTHEDHQAMKRVYTFDLNTQSYNDGISIPDEVINEAGEEQRFVYQLVGATQSGNLLLLSPTGYNRYMAMGMDTLGKILFKGEIYTGEHHSVYQDFYLSEDGILSSISFQEDKAQVSWWRTDRLFKE